jgi:putative ABC transport system permease protein
VLGDSVARELGYQIGDALIVAHGTGEGSFTEHDDLPFRVIAILEPTGTPVDRTVHVSLQGIEAIHGGWESVNHRDPGLGAAEAGELAAEPAEISAFLLGVTQPTHTLQIQRAINEYPREPLSAILPGVALQELWGLVGLAERALLAVSTLVVLTGLFGMMTVILSGLNERRREMAILRSVGARPRHIFLLLMAESTLLGTFGAVSGALLLNLAMLAGAPYLRASSGLYISAGTPGAIELLVVSAVMVTSMLLGLIPAWRAYRNSLADGLSIHL